MDRQEVFTKNKPKSPQHKIYFDEKYDIPNQVNILPADNVLNNPSSSVNLPPPLPGVFVFDQPNQKTKKSIIDSNIYPLVTSSYNNDVQTLSKISTPNLNQYMQLDKTVPEITSNQNYFQPPALNVYDYQASEQKNSDKLQPLVMSDVDSMLPPQGNVYQSLHPVPVNMFDTSPYCEPKVYQQLEPVSRNDYRVDMDKFVEQKFYQELNPFSVNDSNVPKNENKTYQQTRSVPDLHFIGGQSGPRRVSQTPQQKSAIPPEYATSKLYQQLSKPPKKQVRTNYCSDVKSYHQLKPPGNIEKPKHNLSKSVNHQVHLNTPRPVTTHSSSTVSYQHQNNSQTYHRQPYDTFQNAKVSKYGNDTNMNNSTMNLSPMPNLSFQNKTHTIQRGFQEHKPKVYLELRNPVPRKQTSTPSGSLYNNSSMDLSYQGAAASYNDGNTTRHTNIHPLHSHLQINDNHPSKRLPSPYEFNLSQTNISDMPYILDPNEYNNTQENRREQMLYTPTNNSLKSLNENVSSSTMIPPFHVDEDISAVSLSKTTVSTGDYNASNIVTYYDDSNPLKNKNERNKLPAEVISDLPPEVVPDLANKQIDSNYSDSVFCDVSSSVCEIKTTENLSNDNENKSLAVKEKSHLMINKTDLNFNNNSNHFSSNLDLNQQGSKEKVFFNEKNEVPSVFSNMEDSSNLLNHLLSMKNVAGNKGPNEVEDGSEMLTPYLETKTKVEEKIENVNKSLSEEPTDLSINSHSFEKKFDSNSCEEKNSPLIIEPQSKKQSLCSKNINKTPVTSELTSHENVLNESKQTCLKIASSFQSTSAMSTEVLGEGDKQFLTNINFQPNLSDFSNSTREFCEKYGAKTELLSQINREENTLTACQLGTKHKSFFPNHFIDTGASKTLLSSTVVKSCSERIDVSLINNEKSVVSSRSEMSSNNETKALSESYISAGSSETTSLQCDIDSKAQSDICIKNQTNSENQNSFTPVETVSVSEISANGLSKIEKEIMCSESVNSPRYNSFIPKKNRILYKTQLSKRWPKVSKSCLSVSADSKSLISSSEKNSNLPETLGKTSQAQSESLRHCKSIMTVSEESFKTSEKLTVIPKDCCNLKSSKSSELIDQIIKASTSLCGTKVKHEDEKDKLTCQSLDVNQVSIKDSSVLETQSNVRVDNISPPKECIATESNILIKSMVKSNGQFILNENKTEIKTNESCFLNQNVSVNDSLLLDTQDSNREKKPPLSKKQKLLQSEQRFGGYQNPPYFKETVLSKLQIVKNEKVASQSKTCNTLSLPKVREKEPNIVEIAEVQCNKPQSTKIKTEHTLGTKSSMKRKFMEISGRINDSNDKCNALTDDSKSPLDDSVKSHNLSDNNLVAVKGAIRKLRSPRIHSKSNLNVLENKDISNEPFSKEETVIKSLSSKKSKSPRIDTLQKTTLRTKRKYRKTKRFEVSLTLRKTEPLVKSKYSKRIIKKKKLDFGSVEPVKKPKKPLKRKYTNNKPKNLPIKLDSSESKPVKSKISPLPSAKIKYELVDPLEKGLITDDEGEAVFLGFDSPQDEDDTVLGFDFNEDEDMEPINEFLQQLDADSMTVECDPRSLLQAPGMTTLCPQCGKALDSHQELVDHMQWHDSSGAHVCCVCLRAFNTQAQLDKHTKWNHEGGKRFSCPVCSKRFTTNYYIKKHLATVHGQHEAEMKYICPECTLPFKSEKKMSKHMDKVHKKTLYQCNKCLRNFLKLANLERHKRSHEEEGEKFPCAYCNEKFNSRAQLHAHWPTHSEKKSFICEICNRSFTALPSLRRHKILHAGEKLFRCDICQKSFALMSTLKTHLLVHSGIKRFPCKLCDKSFNRQDVLNAHQWIHTGEKKFECDICLQKFRWRHAVKSHKLIYHSTEKPYECDICGKRFSHPESFKKHAEVHAEKLYYCQICLKSFSRPSSLKLHILIHTDLKPFVCDLCNKGFRHKSHLRKHFLVHTSEKPWLCKFCNRMYKDRSQLRRHKRVVHCKNFFKEVLPGVPESLKTVENFEMIADGETSVHANQEYFQQNNVLDSGNLMSHSSKHFILGNLDGSFSNSEDNSVPDSTEDKSLNTEDGEISSSPIIEDHLIDREKNCMPQNNTAETSGPPKQENVLLPSAF